MIEGIGEIEEERVLINLRSKWESDEESVEEKDCDEIVEEGKRIVGF